MIRWLRHRRLWSAVFATTAAVGLAFGHGGKDAPASPAKVGDVISLKFREGPERQFKVLKVEKQADGMFQYELKDTKTGETITLLDKGVDIPLAQSPAPQGSEPLVPKLNLGPLPTNPPMSPPVRIAPPVIPSDVPPVRITPPAITTEVPPVKNALAKPDSKQNTTAGMAAMPEQPQDPPKRPGLLSRIFGWKKTPPSANTNTSSANTANVTLQAPTNTLPPPVRPTPGLFPSATGTTAEPPRMLPIQPVAPPYPSLFQNSSPPPLVPKPLVPSPASSPPMIPLLPSTPIPPSGMSSSSSSVMHAGYLSPVTVAMIQDIQPYVTTLRTAHAPSERILALQSLAGCRHASSETVKRVLFQACKSDPCPLVRACCIDELCKLGYFDPAFVSHLKVAYVDNSDEVHDAAKEAMKKMMPTR